MNRSTLITIFAFLFFIFIYFFISNSLKNRDNFLNKITRPTYNKITSCPILVNTSFNVRGEPIVCTVTDAFKCFMGTDLDLLICENFILYKEKQKAELKNNYKDKFKLD